MENQLNWNQTEFTTFLLIYAAYADLEFTEDERQLILTKVSQETFDKMMAAYDEMTDFGKLQAIMDYKGLYYPTIERKKELLHQMAQLYNADGEYSTLEKNLMLFLHKLL